MSQPFVKIDGKQLQLKANLNFASLGNVKVVSILGKARMGKSSFLNCIASHLTKNNKKIFSSLGGFDHITKGIDFYHMPEENLLLLDSQGLAYEDCSHDPMLLLFVYLVSDVIVFNERMMLQNEALKLLEPVCAFLNFIDLDDIVKPTLFFRISDGDMLGTEPQKNLDKVLAEYQDQYQSIRNSIRHLFQDPIGIVKTNQLDKAAKAFIDAGTFKPLLSDEENGFAAAIDTIMNAARRPSDKKNTNITNLPHIIDQINNKDKIDITKLDVVYLTTDKNISTWIQEIPKENYYPIEVDGKQKTFEELVVPRQNKKKALLTSFTKKFKTVSDEIKNSYYQKLNQDLSAPIDQAISKSTEMAELRVAQKKIDALGNPIQKFPTIDSRNSSFTATANAGFILSYLRQIGELEIACADIYEPVKNKYTEICKAVNSAFVNTLNLVKAEEANILAKVNEYFDATKNTFIEDYSKEINALNESYVTKTNEQIIKDIHTKFIENVQTSMHILCYGNEISGVIVQTIANFKVDYKKHNITHIEKYDLIKEPYSRFLKSISELEIQLSDILTKHKKQLLFRKLIPNTPSGISIMSINPQINFIENGLVNETMLDTPCFITEETYNVCYLPIIQMALNHLIAKGYTDESIILHKIEQQGNLYHYNYFNQRKYIKNIVELLGRKITKLYCKEVIKGMKFGTLLTV